MQNDTCPEGWKINDLYNLLDVRYDNIDLLFSDKYMFHSCKYYTSKIHSDTAIKHPRPSFATLYKRIDHMSHTPLQHFYDILLFHLLKV